MDDTKPRNNTQEECLSAGTFMSTGMFSGSEVAEEITADAIPLLALNNERTGCS